MELSKRLDNFELKLRQLASKFERQQHENKALADENSTLKKELDRQHGVVSSLKEKLESSAKSLGETNGTSATNNNTAATSLVTRAEIDACIRELDICIEWLEKH